MILVVDHYDSFVYNLVQLIESLGARTEVVRSDAEAALIQRAYRALGPLPRRATEAAFRGIRRALGRGRPVQAYLDALSQRVVATPPNKQRKRRP